MRILCIRCKEHSKECMGSGRLRYNGSISFLSTLFIRAGLLRGFDAENSQFIQQIAIMNPDRTPFDVLNEMHTFTRAFACF